MRIRATRVTTPSCKHYTMSALGSLQGSQCMSSRGRVNEQRKIQIQRNHQATQIKPLAMPYQIQNNNAQKTNTWRNKSDDNCVTTEHTQFQNQTQTKRTVYRN